MHVAVGDARFVLLAALHGVDDGLDLRQVLRMDARERRRADQLIGAPADDAVRRRRNIAQALVEPDPGDHVAGAFREQAEMRFLLDQGGGHVLAALQLPHQHRADDGDQHHQREHIEHAGNRGGTPRREQLVLVDRREQDEWIAAGALEEADALDAIQWRLEMRGATRPLQAWVPEQRGVANVTADEFLVARVARDDQAVAVNQRHGAVAADLELLVEMRKIFRADRRQHHATETAVRLVETARQGDHPFAVQKALHGVADMGLALGRELMVTKEGVVAERRGNGAGRGQPVALLVDDGEAVDALDRLLAHLEQAAQLRDRDGVGAVHLQPADDADDTGIQEIEAVLGMLRQGAGDVRHLRLGAFEHRVARRPFAPAADAEDRHASEHDERCRAQRQAARSNSL